MLSLVLTLVACRDDLVDVRRPGTTTTSPPTPPTTDPTTPTPPTTTPTGTTPTGTTTPPDGDPYAVVPTPPLLPQGALSDIAARIDAIRASTVASTGVYIVDLENGQEIYGSAEDTPKKPASNTKLFTTGLAFDQLGEDHRMDVRAFGSAAPDGAGRVPTLTVLGEHDFTWSTFFYESELFPTDRLADRLWEAGVRSVGSLVAAGEFQVEGYQFGTYDAAAYRSDAILALEASLVGRGITVGGTSTSSSFATPAGVLLAERGSAPLATAAHPLNVYSHNEFADLLSRHDGWLLGGSSTYGEGTDQVIEWLDGAGIDTRGMALNDGSGLSHDNRVTPRQVVELLAFVSGRPSGTAWRRTFSIGGVIGTLGSRMTAADTAGRFYGKSGTLTGVIATSGILFHRHDGHRYAISVLMNDVTDDTFARSLEDDVVEVVADDHRGLGERPSMPRLRSVLAPGDGTLVIEWEAAAAAAAHVVWLSADGLVWDRAEARLVTGTRHVAGGLTADRTLHVRVTATNAAGEGPPSSVLSARTSLEPAEILLVDGNDRWLQQPENPLGEGHDFLVGHAASLGSRPFESVAHAEVSSGTVEPADYLAVLWELGEQSSADGTFEPAEQAAIEAALGSGTGLLVSGAELAWDLDWLGDAGDRAFLQGSLGVGYAGDDAETHSLMPIEGGLFDGLGELGFYTPGTLDVAFPDQLSPQGGAVAELSYVGGAGGVAATSLDSGAGRVVVMGFPFESVDTADRRAELLERVLAFFGI